uniref:Zgc:162396 n=1 Tax=Sphaeramia orbicularis TaxID=375764 RepID=A0A673ABK4_9TELE
MAYRLFEGKDHAAVYQKYRMTPPDQLKNIILEYLDQKKGRPHVLAVDVGCGTGQNCRLMAPHFHNVVGIDISECQLEEAKAEPGHPNITYRRGAAEELPFADASVDLITAASAAHWFDQSRFLDEVSRVLKPRGCVALLGFCDDKTTFHFQDCGQRLNHIYEEFVQISFITNQRTQCCLPLIHSCCAVFSFDLCSVHLSVDTGRLWASMGLSGTVFFIASKLDSNWINATMLSRPRTPGVSGGEWSCGRSSAGLDARIPRTDWRISRKDESRLIDSYFEIYSFTDTVQFNTAVHSAVKSREKPLQNYSFISCTVNKTHSLYFLGSI